MLTELRWVNGPWPCLLAVAARPRGGDWLAVPEKEEQGRWIDYYAATGRRAPLACAGR